MRILVKKCPKTRKLPKCVCENSLHSTRCMINREFVVNQENNERPDLEIVLDDIKKLWISSAQIQRNIGMFSEVSEDIVAEATRLYFMLRHAGYPEEMFWSVFFNCGKNCLFSLLNKDTKCPPIFKAILTLFES